MMYVRMLRNWLGLLYCRRRDKEKQLHVFVEIPLYIKFTNMAVTKIFGYVLRPKHAMRVTNQCVRTRL